jgi:hypothetical protein
MQTDSVGASEKREEEERKNCPACNARRCHLEIEWKNHPLRGHGWNGTRWTHPILETEAKAAKQTAVVVLKTKVAGGGA